MMDEMVLEVQKWLNKTYDDINVAEDATPVRRL